MQDRKKILQSILISCFLTFTLCVFGPIEMYIGNQAELWFNMTDIVILSLISAVILLLLLSLLLICTRGKTNRILESLIFGLGVALYIQGNYMVINYGVLDGNKIDWSQFTTWAIINSLVWISFIAAPFLIMKLTPKWYKKIILTISAFFIAIQIVTLAVLVFTVDFQETDSAIVTEEDLFGISSNKNIIVFVLDTLDAGYMNDCLIQYPEVENSLEDFIYYDNVIGAYPTTKGAMPQILTGKWYDNSQGYSEYIDSAWKNSSLLSELSNNNYNLKLYTQDMFLSNSLVGTVNNLETGGNKVKSYVDLGKLYYKFTLFKYLPHIMKKNFVMYSGEFEGLKETTGSFKPYNINEQTNYYTKLCENGLSTKENKNIFVLYHFYGSHAPFVIDEMCEKISNGESDAIKETRGGIRFVEKYIEELKLNNCYENATIVIMGDHGGESEGDIYGYRQNPALLIKYSHADSPFSISSAFVSYEDLKETFESCITEKYDKSIRTLSQTEIRPRKYMYYTWDSQFNKANYMPDMKEYLTYNFARNMNPSDATGKIYTDEGVISNSETYAYTLNKIIDFTNKNFLNTVDYGLSHAESGFTWTTGKQTEIDLMLNEKINYDLTLQLDSVAILGNKQRVSLQVNGNYIGEKEITQSERSLEFIIPREYIKGRLIDMKISYPDAVSPGNGDIRILAIGFKSMKLSENVAFIVENDNQLDFSKKGNSELADLQGWFGQEENGRWTSKDSQITVQCEAKGDMEMNIEFYSLESTKPVKLLFNGTEVGELEKNDSGEKKICIPCSLFNDDGNQVITFLAEDAESPKSLGVSNDTRELGVFVSRIIFEVGE